MRKQPTLWIVLLLLHGGEAGAQPAGPSLHALFLDLEQIQREFDRATFRFDYAYTDGFRDKNGATGQAPHLAAGNLMEVVDEMPGLIDRYELRLSHLQQVLAAQRRPAPRLAVAGARPLRPLTAQGGGDPLGEILDPLSKVRNVEDGLLLASRHVVGVGKIIDEARRAYAERMRDFLIHNPNCGQYLDTCCENQAGVSDCQEFATRASDDDAVGLCFEVDSDRRCGLPNEKPFLADPVCQQAWEAGGKPFTSLITDWATDAGGMIGSSFLGGYLDKIKAISDWDVIDVVKPKLEDALAWGVGQVLAEDSPPPPGGGGGAAMPARWRRVDPVRAAAAAAPGAVLLLWDESADLVLLLSSEAAAGGALFPRVPQGRYKAVLLADGREYRVFEDFPVDAGATTQVPPGPPCDPSPSGCGLMVAPLDDSTDFVNTAAGFCLDCARREWEGTLEATFRGIEPCPEGAPDQVTGTFRVSFVMRDVVEPGPPRVRRFKSDPASAQLTWVRFNHRPCKDECTQRLSSSAHPVTYVNVGRWLDDGSGYEIETHGLGDAMPFHPISCDGAGTRPAMPNVYLGLIGGQLVPPSLLDAGGDRTVRFTSPSKDRLERIWSGGRSESGTSLQMTIQLNLEKQ